MPIDQRKLQLMFQQHGDYQADYSRSLWALLSLALWEQKHYRTRFQPQG